MLCRNLLIHLVVSGSILEVSIRGAAAATKYYSIYLQYLLTKLISQKQSWNTDLKGTLSRWLLCVYVVEYNRLSLEEKFEMLIYNVENISRTHNSAHFTTLLSSMGSESACTYSIRSEQNNENTL